MLSREIGRALSVEMEEGIETTDFTDEHRFGFGLLGGFMSWPV
jgi:hypothetical protein